MKAAEKGNPKAMHKVATFYKCGKMLEVDYSKAIEYLTKAADLNHSESLFILGICYLNGEGFGQDNEKVGKFYIIEESYSKALPCIQKAAELKNLSAIFVLSIRNMN